MRAFVEDCGLWKTSRGRLAVIAVGLAVANWIVVKQYVWPAYIDEAASRGASTLRLTVASMLGTFQQYEKLPALFAEDQLVKQLVQEPDNTYLVELTNQSLAYSNEVLRSSDIYLLTPDGITIAASNYNSAVSFIGHDFSFRPYFRMALSGGNGSYFALGATSFKRGYYFSSPVIVSETVKGVMVFKVGIEEMESALSGSSENEIIVTDHNGVVFMSSEPEWLYHSLSPLSDEKTKEILDSRQYSDIPVTPLPFEFQTTDRDYRTAILNRDDEPRHFVQVTERLEGTPWSVHVLSDTKGALAQTILSAIALILAQVLLAGILLAFLSRQKRFVRQVELQRKIQHELEVRVEARTSALLAAKRVLEKEIQDRVATEKALRETQSDLVRASKLAALGRMSAAVSHEFNQPLTAIRAYADSAVILIELRRYEEARSTVARVVAMADRMAEIGRTLRSFARNPGKLERVELIASVSDALEVVAQRLASVDADIEIDVSNELVVLANQSRLTQALVNIIANAADAVEGRNVRSISVRAQLDGDVVRIEVSDTGPGIPADQIKRIFDPFYSTKTADSGGGMGLGLSISYNVIKELEGEISVTNSALGGALFKIMLPAYSFTQDSIAAQ